MQPKLSAHFRGRKPSDIRKAQILFGARPDNAEIRVVNVAIGNVSLPMHPAMAARMSALNHRDSPFAGGIVKYTASVGLEETRQAFLNILGSTGCDTTKLNCLVTDGGSQAMELMVLGVCGPAAREPLLLLDPAYTNYRDMAARAGVKTVCVRRELDDNGAFSAPDLTRLANTLGETKARGIVVIPADNPTGQFLELDELETICRIAVDHNVWIVSDEAYRELHYSGSTTSSVWAITDRAVPGVEGRRISIETASKVWNACGLRIGALVTDNKDFHRQAVAEYTANLCSNAIGQYIFGALAKVSHENLRIWYDKQRAYYAPLMRAVVEELRAALPGVIVSNPDASLYSVVDVRNVEGIGPFDAGQFVAYCAEKGIVEIDRTPHTLLTAPMSGFYDRERNDGAHPSDTQMRIAFVEPPDEMRKVPKLFCALLRSYLAAR